MFKVLLALTNMDDIERLSHHLMQHSMFTDHALSGKDAQLMCYNVRYSAVVLDMALTNHSAFEVLRYYKLTRPTMKVIAWVKDPEQFKVWDVPKSELAAMGANIVLEGQPTVEEFHKALSGNVEFQDWKKVDKNAPASQEEQVEGVIPDEEFSPLRITDFISGNTSFFDFYVRISENRYIKVLHRGELFLEEQLARYQKSGKIDFLYFRNSDRRQYINYMNEMTQKLFSNNKVSVSTKSNLTKSLLDKFVEEVYVQGLPPDLYEEGENACRRVMDLISSDKDLTTIMRNFEENDLAAMSHCTLTTFYSAAITKNLSWGSEQIIEKVTMGAILHDIGKLKLPKELQSKKASEMTHEEMELYKQHPQWGYDLVKKIKYVPMPVKHIILQHHERSDGSGFPEGLQGLNIYPPAKIVGFADYFVHYLVEHRLHPLDGFSALLKNRAIFGLFDPEIVKALIKGFILKN